MAMFPLTLKAHHLYDNDDVDVDDDDGNNDHVEYYDDNADDSDVQVREKEEAWRKYKDAVEEGKTAGGRIYSDHDDVQELDMMSTIFQEISSK